MLKVGVIGCGKIADAHALSISRINNCKIVGGCDKEGLMSKQFCERYGVGLHFDDVSHFLEKSRPDVVHITTPPQSHFELGKMCLDFGCHVYIEKPFTVYTAQAEQLIRLAENNGLKITVGHNDQFTHATRNMRALIEQGYLGGPPVHMESYYCYEMGEGQYAKSLLGDSNHWIRRLPGTLMQNNISHGICRIAEYFPEDNPTVITHGFVSPLLTKSGETQIIDEARVILSMANRTAYFTFSTQMRPAMRSFRIFGPKNGLMVDHDQQILIKLRGNRYKSYLEKFIPQYGYAAQYAGNSLSNIRRFLASDFHMMHGMKYLIEAFYNSIIHGTRPVIPHEQIVRTSKIMDSIFTQLSNCGATGGTGSGR